MSTTITSISSEVPVRKTESMHEQVPENVLKFKMITEITIDWKVKQKNG